LRIPTLLLTAYITLIFNAAVAQAQTGYYKVVELTEGDHLNVRSGPGSDFEDIGDLESGLQPLEVLETDASGNWGRILWLEGNGWVALSYLESVAIEKLTNTEIPIGLTCVGANPFWTMEFKSQKVGVITTQEAVTPMNISNITKSRNSRSFPVAVELQTKSYTTTATLRRAQCSDGMGGLRYGWATDVLINPQFSLLSGCCVLR